MLTGGDSFVDHTKESPVLCPTKYRENKRIPNSLVIVILLL